ERIHAHQGDDLALQPELLLELPEHRLLRALPALEKARHEAEPALGPSLLAHQHDVALALTVFGEVRDDGRDHGKRIVVVNEAAPFHGAALALPPLGGERHQRGAAAKTEPSVLHLDLLDRFAPELSGPNDTASMPL